MKKLFLLPVLAGVLALGLSTTSCETSGHAKAQSTGLRMDDLRASLQLAKQKAQAAGAALASIVERADVDPKPHFATYKKEIAAFDSAVSASERNLKALSDGSHAYFVDWEMQATQMRDPDLKRASEDRRVRLERALEDVAEAMDKARPSLTSFSTTLKDMQIYLNNDLTPGGIQSVGDKIRQVQKSADSVGAKLDDVVQVLEKGAPQFKTAGPPPTAKSPRTDDGSKD